MNHLLCARASEAEKYEMKLKITNILSSVWLERFYIKTETNESTSLR